MSTDDIAGVVDVPEAPPCSIPLEDKETDIPPEPTSSEYQHAQRQAPAGS